MARRFDHSVSREPIEFGMGGDDYTAPPLLAPDTLGDLLDKQKTVSSISTGDVDRKVLDEIRGAVADMFDLILEPESAARVRERLFSRTNPFDLSREVMPTIRSLVEEYTGSPIQPSPPSSDGSATAGTISTAGAPVAELTPSPSELAVSST